MKAILGKKLRMTRVYNDEGLVVPVTLLDVEPCTVSRIKTEEGKDGYVAAQIAFGTKKTNNGKEKPRVLREVRCSSEEANALEEGGKLTVEMFEPGDVVKVTGTSKGRGFAGVVKRHGFAGAPKTHGHKHDLRSGGSIGAGFPQHVMKDMKMPGRMGGKKNSVRGLSVVAVDAEANVLAVKGSVPGAPGGLVMIQAIS